MLGSLWLDNFFPLFSGVGQTKKEDTFIYLIPIFKIKRRFFVFFYKMCMQGYEFFCAINIK